MKPRHLRAKLAASLTVAAFLLGLAGCGSTRSLPLDTFDPLLRAVADTHDEYVTKDATLLPVERQSRLQNTAILRHALDVGMDRKP